MSASEARTTDGDLIEYGRAYEAARALREIAAFIVENPEFAKAVKYARLVYVATPDEFADRVRQLGGQRVKSADSNYVSVQRSFGPEWLNLRIDVCAPRDEVCTRKVVGTETVEIADPDAPKVTVEREIVEWECNPVLGAA